MAFADFFNFQSHIQQLESEGRVTRTFRRLDSSRQQAVINAILEEAAEKGPASLNIKEIARRADIAVGSLYQYFPNRDGLLDFAIELCTRYMKDMFDLSVPYLKAMPLKGGNDAKSHLRTTGGSGTARRDPARNRPGGNLTAGQRDDDPGGGQPDAALFEYLLSSHR
jgi:AcrR family transcriptional regulator